MDCVICFEKLETDGEHQMAALKCGHVFGKKCIREWLSQNHQRCPFCNKYSNHGDILKLYFPISTKSPPKTNNNLSSNFNLSHIEDFNIDGINRNSNHLYINWMNSLYVNVFNGTQHGIQSILLDNSNGVLSDPPLYIHSDVIEGMVADISVGKIITVSRDKNMMITLLREKMSYAQIELDDIPFCVDIHPEKPYIYVGFQNSYIAVYDERYLNNSFISLLSYPSQESSIPVESLINMKYNYNNDSQLHGLLSIHSASCWLHCLDLDQYEAKQLPLARGGYCYSSSYDAQSRYILLSIEEESCSSNFVLAIDYDDENEFQPRVINIIPNESLSRSKIHTNPLDETSVLVCSSTDYGAKIWDHEMRFNQSINIGKNVKDFQFLKTSRGENMLSCLTKDGVKLYKITNDIN